MTISSEVAAANEHSVLGIKKLSSLQRCLEQAQTADGASAELGVYRGGSALLIASVASQKPCYLFDTFEGIPVKDETDVHGIGDFSSTTLQAVQQLLAGCNNVHFRVGYFPDTARGLEETRYSFVHIDGDQYQTTKAALEYFYPRMNDGGIMLFDDYEWMGCPGVKKAIQEFMQDKPEKLEHPHLYQAAITKGRRHYSPLRADVFRPLLILLSRIKIAVRQKYF